MTVRRMRMMRGLFMIAVLMMFCRCPMMPGRVLVMLRRSIVMFNVVFGHGILFEVRK